MKYSFKDVNDDPSLSEYPLPGCHRPNVYNPGYVQNPCNIRNQILRDLELEKKMIREQLLVASNAHKLVMEAGVRIELLLERQMTIVRDDHFPLISSGSQGTRYDNRLSVKDRIGPPQGIREYINIHPKLCLEPKLVEKIPNLEISNDIIPAKSPDLFCGEKREAEKPLPKERNCAICKLTFSNAQKLNDHIHGREHDAAFRRFFKIENSNGDHKLEQNTNVPMIEIDDSEKENRKSEVQFPSLTNSNEKLLSLFKGSENMMNGCRSREKNSGEFVEVAQDGGIFKDKISTDEKETNKASTEVGMPNDINNSEQNNCDSGKKSGNLSANLVKTGDGNAYDSTAHDNDSPLQKNISRAKRKAEKQPLEAVGTSKIPSAISTRTIFKEKSQGGRKEAAEIRKTLAEEMNHKAAERRKRFGTELVPEDSNKRVKIAENRNLEQVMQNTEKFKKISSEKNESAEAATVIITDSMRENGNPEVQTQKVVYSNKELLALSISQNGGSQVGKAVKVEQKIPKISASKDKEIHKVEEAKPVGYVSGLKHKAETQPLEKVVPSNVSSAGAKKKPNQEFRCELCQVVVYTERSFNGHIQGKKHKAAERRGSFVIGSVPKDNNSNIKLSLIPKHMGLANNSLANNNLSLNPMTLESSNTSLANNTTKLSLDPKNLQSANNSLGKIAEKHNNSKLVRLNEFGEVFPPKISQTCPESVQNDKGIQSSEAFAKEIKKKNELLAGATNIDSSEKENGSSAVQMVKLVTNNENFMASPKLLKVTSEHEKKVDSHKKKQKQLVEFCGSAQNVGLQEEKAFTEEQKANKISSEIAGTKDEDNKKLEQAISQGNASGSKRKAPPEISIPSVGPKKKLKQVFTCELCHVVSEEKPFKQHIHGMRHKANLEAQRWKWFTFKIAEAFFGCHSAQMNKIRNAYGLRKEIAEKNELTFLATENNDDRKVENGISALEMVNLTTSTEKFESGPSICNLGNNHKIEKIDLILQQVTPCVDEMKKETKDKNDLALLVTHSKICTKVTLDTVKRNGTSTDIVLNVNDRTNYESIACKNKFALVGTSNTSDSEKDNRKPTDTMQKTGDVNGMVGECKRHLHKLLEVAKNDESQAEDASNEEKETMEMSLNISGAQENRNLEQKADEPEQETKIESESQLIRNITNKSENDADNLTENTLETANGSKKFKFVCTICKVGHNSERVMIDHYSKERHLQKLRQLAENRVPVCVEKAANGIPENEGETKQRCEGSFSERP